jgi:hypothetical protein
MTEQHLSALLTTAEAKKASDGWVKPPEGRHLTFYTAFNGASLTVSRVDAVRSEGGLVRARTAKGETFVLALADIFAGSIDASPSSGRKAGFTAT